MFIPHNTGVALVLAAYLLYSGTAPFFAYLTRLDGIIKRGRARQSCLRVGRATEVPHLDVGALEATTLELKTFGFVESGDYVSFSREMASARAPLAPLASPVATSNVPPDPMETAGFCRVFLHEKERCIAKLIASTVMPKDGRRPTTVFVRAIISFADAPDGADIWGYSTSDRMDKGSTSAIMALWRRPRSLSTRLPGAPLAEVWRLHLERRAQVAEVAGLRWNRACVREALESETRSDHNMCACFERLTPLKMAWQLRRFKAEKSNTEWLGELSGKLPTA